jgi:hypothetical protein
MSVCEGGCQCFCTTWPSCVTLVQIFDLLELHFSKLRYEEINTYLMVPNKNFVAYVEPTTAQSWELNT